MTLDSIAITRQQVDEDTMIVNMGPSHPTTHGTLRIILELQGETIVKSTPEMGYLHRGVEKICENSDYHHVITQMDPLEYVSSLFCEWAPVLAFEQLLDVQVSGRSGRFCSWLKPSA